MTRTESPQAGSQARPRLRARRRCPRELVWKAWTMPEHLKKWFTPAPWQTVECEIDLRPGGIFRTVMRSPEGQDLRTRLLPEDRHRTRGSSGPTCWCPATGRPGSVAAGCLGEPSASSPSFRSHRTATGRDTPPLSSTPTRRAAQARADGIPGRLGQGVRSARRPRQDM